MAVKNGIKRLYNGDFVICEGKEEPAVEEEHAQTIEAVEAAAEAAVSELDEEEVEEEIEEEA